MAPNSAVRYMEIEHQLELLRRQYLQLVEPDQLSLPASLVLKMPEVQAKIYTNLFSGSSHAYLPPRRYRFRVLKRLLDCLEKAVEDPEEDVRSPSTTSFTFL